MVINLYEHTHLKNEMLPEAWRSSKKLEDFEDFLQQNWEQRTSFYDDGKITKKQQFLGFTGRGGIKTKNYIGTIVFEGEQLNIFPKMFRTDADSNDISDLSQEHMMKNLVRWLDYCNKISYQYISISSELTDANDLREFFITLYISYVRNALATNRYYQYVDETKDLRCIKGKFDIKDYVLNKIPNGKGQFFQCTYSKFEYDNLVNRIIKYTCRLLYNVTSSNNQKSLTHILNALDEVTLERCTPADCSKIKLGCINKNYRVIISMSRMFLLNQLSNLTMDLNESFSFLFPAELLFEGFIGGYMQEVLEDFGGKVFLQKSDMALIDELGYAGKNLGAAFTMRHDILVELQDKVFILDTKYKQVPRFEDNPDEIKDIVTSAIAQDDVYQVCEYARKRNISDVYLLYPLYRYEDNEPEFPKGFSNSASGNIKVHFIRLPFVFEQDEEQTKTMLRTVILDILGLQ